MTTKDKLKALIQKAIDGGWLGIPNGYVGERCWYYPDGNDLLKWSWTADQSILSDGAGDDYEEIHISAVIFNHEFARALFGNEPTHELEQAMAGPPDTLDNWQYHLQQAVILEDPINYMYQAVFKV